jgi:hypothetical protein
MELFRVKNGRYNGILRVLSKQTFETSFTSEDGKEVVLRHTADGPTQRFGEEVFDDNKSDIFTDTDSVMSLEDEQESLTDIDVEQMEVAADKCVDFDFVKLQGKWLLFEVQSRLLSDSNEGGYS